MRPGVLRPGAAAIQASHIEVFRAHHSRGADARVSQGLVVVPTDTASEQQRAKYAAYAESRMARTATRSRCRSPSITRTMYRS